MLGTGYSCQIIMKLEFSRKFFYKNLQISNSTKIRRAVAELFHADGQTDTHDEFDVILTVHRR